MKADPMERRDCLGMEVNVSGEHGVPGRGGEYPGSKRGGWEMIPSV